MKKMSLAVLVSFFAMAGAAYAQTDNGVQTSTDPATAAAVEQHAQELQSQQQNMPASSTVHHPMHHRAMHHKMMKKSDAASAPEAASQ
jgi:hypothetical protein